MDDEDHHAFQSHAWRAAAPRRLRDRTKVLPERRAGLRGNAPALSAWGLACAGKISYRREGSGVRSGSDVYQEGSSRWLDSGSPPGE